MKKRLQAVCACIDSRFHSLIDIGYDHGQVLRWARHAGIQSLIGVETDDAFAERYRVRYGDDGVVLHTGNALCGLAADLGEVLVFSGLGEEHIRRMLEQSPDCLKHAQQIIFCPSSIDLQLRNFLNTQQWRIDREQYVHEGGRSYLVASARPGIESIEDPEIAALAPRLCSSESRSVATSSDDLDHYLRFVARRFHWPVDAYLNRIYKKIASLK